MTKIYYSIKFREIYEESYAYKFEEPVILFKEFNMLSIMFILKWGNFMPHSYDRQFLEMLKAKYLPKETT